MEAAVEMPRSLLGMPLAELNPRSKLLYIAIADLCKREGGSTVATRGRMSEITGLPDKAIQRALDELLGKRMIRREQDPTLPHRPFRTWIVLEKTRAKPKKRA